MDARLAERWPAWVKAFFVAMALLAVLVVLPWVLMWSGCAAMVGPMQQMMDSLPRRMP